MSKTTISSSKPKLKNIINKIIALNNYLKYYVHDNDICHDMELTIELYSKKTHILNLHFLNRQFYMTTPYYSGGNDDVIYPNAKMVYDYPKIIKDHPHLTSMLYEFNKTKLHATMYFYRSVKISKSIREKLELKK